MTRLDRIINEAGSVARRGEAVTVTPRGTCGDPSPHPAHRYLLMPSIWHCPGVPTQPAKQHTKRESS